MIKNRKYFVNLMLLVTSVLFILIVSEIGVRVFYSIQARKALLTINEKPPKHFITNELCEIIMFTDELNIIYSLRPDIDVVFINSVVITNMEGFRDREFVLDKPAGTYRIIGLGDSFAFGWGVNQEKDYLSLLENNLNKRSPGAGVYEVMNFGVPGYNTVMEVETLKIKALKYKPDLVIVSFVANDMSLPNFITLKDDFTSMQKSFLFDLVLRRTFDLEAKMTIDSNTHVLGWPPDRPIVKVDNSYDIAQVPDQYKGMVGWKAFRNALFELKALQNKEGFNVIFLLHFGGTQNSINSLAQIEIERAGFPVLNMDQYFTQYLVENKLKWEGAPLSLSIKDTHPSEFAHALIAARLEEYLVSRLPRLSTLTH